MSPEDEDDDDDDDDDEEEEEEEDDEEGEEQQEDDDEEDEDPATQDRLGAAATLCRPRPRTWVGAGPPRRGRARRTLIPNHIARGGPEP